MVKLQNLNMLVKKSEIKCKNVFLLLHSIYFKDFYKFNLTFERQILNPVQHFPFLHNFLKMKSSWILAAILDFFGVKKIWKIIFTQENIKIMYNNPIS